MKNRSQSKFLWGMVHVGALPGTPRFQGDFEKIVEKAVEEAKVLKQAGFTSVLFENMHDVPYLKEEVGPEISAAMAVVGLEIKKATQLSIGIQILAGASRASMSVAHALGADWVRVEGFVFGHIADEGYIESCAGDLLRFKKELGADSVRVMADIKKKHSSHAITKDVDIIETARTAEFFGADAVVLTGAHTGEKASEEELREVKKSVKIPVFIGSGITAKNIKRYQLADGFIVGSSLKREGLWENPIDANAASQITRAFQDF